MRIFSFRKISASLSMGLFCGSLSFYIKRVAHHLCRCAAQHTRVTRLSESRHKRVTSCPKEGYTSRRNTKTYERSQQYESDHITFASTIARAKTTRVNMRKKTHCKRCLVALKSTVSPRLGHRFGGWPCSGHHSRTNRFTHAPLTLHSAR